MVVRDAVIRYRCSRAIGESTHIGDVAHVAEDGWNGDHVDEGQPGRSGSPPKVFGPVHGHICQIVITCLERS